MMFLLSGTGLRYNEKAIAAGAQTERRGGAGPVRALLDRKDLTGRFYFHHRGARSPEQKINSMASCLIPLRFRRLLCSRSARRPPTVAAKVYVRPRAVAPVRRRASRRSRPLAAFP